MVEVETRSWTPIVCSEDDQGILEHVGFPQSFNNFSNRLVQFGQHSGKLSPLWIFDVCQLLYYFFGSLKKVP